MNLIKLKALAQLRVKTLEEQDEHYQQQVIKHNLAAEHSKNFLNFVLYTKQDYILNWHHKYLCQKLNDFSNGLIKNMAVFMPPQHGKSELVSRRLPAYMLGKNPNLKFLGISYSADLSKSFNRDCQKIMKSESYAQIFRLTENKDVSGFRYAERADYFEIEGYSGSYKSAGIDGSVTGFSADILSIDDPVKGFREAKSPTERENTWSFYTDVVETRCHNDTQKLLTMTRWNEDDLAGRILSTEPGQWEIIIFPAIKEHDLNIADPREIGEALWPEKHSLERLESMREKSPRTFISLYQQRPAPEEGDIIKKAWFKRFNSSDLPKDIKRNFRSDTAYGKEKSDNSSTFSYSVHEGNLYLWNLMSANLSYPAFKRAYISFLETNGYTEKSRAVFEPKATGISVVQDLKEARLSNGLKINVIEDTPPKDSKETRVSSVSSIIESGRVFLLEGSGWIEAFLLQCAIFPNGKHDDDIDNLAGILIREFLSKEPDLKIAFG